MSKYDPKIRHMESNLYTGAEKRVTLKASHTNHGELPYEKQKWFQTTEITTRLYVSGAPFL